MGTLGARLQDQTRFLLTTSKWGVRGPPSSPLLWETRFIAAFTN